MQSEEGETYAQRQEDELQILQSMYGDDVKDLREVDAWKVTRPPEFTLDLTPQDGNSGKKTVYCKLCLKVKFPPTYPDCGPDLKIESFKGISKDEINSLEKELKDLCKKSLGEVMVLQVALFIQEFLHQRNAPPTSAYEEMVRNKQKQLEKEAKEEEKKREIQRKKDEMKRKDIEEALARRQEEERKLKKMQREEREQTNISSEVMKSSSIDSTIKSFGMSQLNFTGNKTSRSIYRGQYLGGKAKSESQVYVGMDATSGELVAIHHWEILCPAPKMMLTDAERTRLDTYLKTISTIDQELQSLVKLSHENIVPFLAMKTTHCERCIEIDLLQEYVKGLSLQHKLDSKEKVSLDVLRNYTEQMLLGLDYLHKKSVVHKNFKVSSIFLEANGSIKVADHSIGKRLVDLYTKSRIEQPGVRFSDDRIPARASKKGDLLRLGIVVLSLAQGFTVKDFPPEICSSFPIVFHNFLDKCLAVEDRLRFSAADLLDHEFIKPGIPSPLSLQQPEPHEPDLVEIEPYDVYDQSSTDDASARSIQLSRLHSEFEELEWLGKGGYGDVVKVRNKLDDRQYAIKRILLNPFQSQFNKKITREVKLLSRLNHENVVRYYNSWIETIQCLKEDLSVSSSSLPTTLESKQSESLISKNSLGLIDDIEKMAPAPASLSEWSMSVEEVSRHGVLEDEEDDGDVFQTIFVDNEESSSSSESILFDHDGEDSTSSLSDEKNTTVSIANTSENNMLSSEASPSYVTQKYLYIQMEYCEKSTLRHIIDAGLCKETDKMWRLFREILEGLTHIHEQGMIHRDLKPQNIFLDRNDHVKIGDFGLATAHSRGVVTENRDEPGSKSEGIDSGLTGAVGTALYVAPELLHAKKRTMYSQKVDIYSVGIIFFEMFYDGLNTKMERGKVLGHLRTPSVIFPPNFDEVLYEREAAITKWCLDHEPKNRPTSSELLRCRLVPTPVLEESHVLDAVREMLSDSNSKPYRLVMDEVFSKPIDSTVSIVYDIDVHTRQFSSTSSIAQTHAFEFVKSILRRHGAVQVHTPLLLPRQDEQDCTNTDAVTLMDTGGTTVTLPYNLTIPFARFVSCNGMKSIKRYAIEKVFRTRRIRRSRPKELWECAFDIVTPTISGLVPDAEVILVVGEIINQFPLLSSRKYIIRINHMMALKGILTHCGIDEALHPEVLSALATCDKLSKSQVQTCLGSLTLNPQQVASLSTFTQKQGPLTNIQYALKSLTRNNQSPSASWTRQALHELEAVKKCLDSFQLNLPITFDLGFVHKHHHHYDGIIFQVSAEIQKKKRTAIDILAIGGRYDKLLESMSYLRMGTEFPANKDTSRKTACAVGVSIAIEKVVAATLAKGAATLNDTSDLSPSQAYQFQHTPVDVLVCAVGRSQLLHERLRLVKRLWDASIIAETAYERNTSVSLHDIQEKVRERGIPHLVLLSDKERDGALVKSFMPDSNGKLLERKVQLENLVDYLSKKLKELDENVGTSRTSNQASPGASSSQESSSSFSSSSQTATRQLAIEIVSPEKLAFNIKKRHEFEIRTKLSALPMMSNISGKAKIVAIAAELPSSIMKTFCCALDINGEEEDFNSSLAHYLHTVSRHKKYISIIAENVYDAKFVKRAPFIILYSYKDGGSCMLI